MKRILFPLLAAGLVAIDLFNLSPAIQAQGAYLAPRYADSPPALSLTGIGTTAASTTTTCTNLVLDVRYFQNVTLCTKFNFSGATTSNVVYSISRSLDKSNWETTPSITWTVAGNGTNNVVATKDVATSGAGWLRLESIQNTHASLVLTNSLFQYSVKRGAP